MPLDWLFGGKKKSEPESIPHADPPPGSGGDDFILLDNDQPVPSSGCTMYPPLPYVVNPQTGRAEDSVATTTSQETVVQSFLSGVPFKLAASDFSPDLNSATASHAGTDIFLSYLRESISSGSFSYDFQVEKSVLQEAGCRDLG